MLTEMILSSSETAHLLPPNLADLRRFCQNLYLIKPEALKANLSGFMLKQTGVKTMMQPLSAHLKGGIRTPFNLGQKRPQSHAVFLCPLKTISAVLIRLKSCYGGLCREGASLAVPRYGSSKPDTAHRLKIRTFTRRLNPQNLGVTAMNTQSTGENRPNSNQSDLSNFPALLTFEQAQQIEHNVCADANRLIMLGVLTNSSDQLKQNFMADDDSKEVLLETFELVTRFKESLKSLTELTDTAIARMAVISGVFEEVAEETSTNKKPA